MLSNLTKQSSVICLISVLVELAVFLNDLGTEVRLKFGNDFGFIGFGIEGVGEIGQHNAR